MSSVNGIGNPQQPISSITPSAASQPIETPVSSQDVKGETPSSSSVQHSDQTTLSSSAAVVAQALKGSDVRLAKISSLQQAIGSGNYSVSSSAVAEKMIQSLLE